MGIKWFSSNQLYLHQGPKSIVPSDPIIPACKSPFHCHILVKTVSQVTIPPRMIAITPTAFNGIPKLRCYCSLIDSLILHELQLHLLVVPVLKILGEKLPLWLLCMIVNTSSDEIVLPKHRHLGGMKPLSNIDNPFKPLVINEVTYAIDSDQVYT